MRLAAVCFPIFSAMIWSSISQTSTGQEETETFITIHKISGNQISYSKATGGGRGGRRRGGAVPQGSPAGGRFGRGRGRFSSAASDKKIATIPAATKITTAFRERRTFDFNVGAEIPGGLRNKLFQKLNQPLQARVVTQGNIIQQLNIITPQSDINQSNSTADGKTVIAIRPKRPPQKKTPQKKTPQKKTPQKKTPQKKTPQKKTPQKKTLQKKSK